MNLHELIYTKRFETEADLVELSHEHLWGDSIINNEEQAYRETQLRIETDEHGVGLSIVLEPTPDNPEAIEDAIGQPYLSGIVTSYPCFSIGPYFKIEFDAMLPEGMGLWPALWLLAIEKNGSWPWGQAMAHEMDIVEKMGREPGNLIHIASHYMPAQGEARHWSTPVELADTVYGKRKTYGVEFAPSGIYTYCDGVRHTVMPLPEAYKTLEWHWLANLACGGAWAELIDDTTPLPAVMRLYEVRAYAPTDDIPHRPKAIADDAVYQSALVAAKPIQPLAITPPPKLWWMPLMDGYQTLTWSPQPGAVKYNIDVRQPDYPGFKYLTTVRRPEFVIPREVPEGTEYRVASIDESNRVGPMSEPLQVGENDWG